MNGLVTEPMGNFKLKSHFCLKIIFENLLSLINFIFTGIRQLQCILLKVALILGVEIHEGVGFERLVPPPDDQSNESE